MRLEQLHYVLEVVRCKSIKKASGRLFITQQSLSQSIKNLEKELDTDLFVRSLNGVFCTEEGEAFAAFAEVVVQEEKRFKARLDAIRAGREQQNLEGSLNIYAFGSYDYTILPKLLSQYRQKYPKVLIRTYPCDFALLESVFSKPNAENTVGLIIVPDLEQPIFEDYFAAHQLSFFPIECSKYYLCCSKENKLAKKKSVSLREAVSCPMIYYGTSSFQRGGIYALMKQYGYADITISLETLSLKVWVDTIINGNYIGFLHEYIYDALQQSNLAEMKNITVVPLEERFENISGYVIRDSCGSTVRRLIELLTQQNI